MTFWLVAGLITLAAVLAMLWPLLAAPAEAALRPDHDMTVYRDQLAELDRDLAEGRLGTEEYGAARIEVERRMLAAGREAARARSAGSGSGTNVRMTRLLRLYAAIIVVAAIPAGALATYINIGRPGVPDLPLAHRATERVHSADPAQQQQGIGEMVAKLERRLADDPDDLDGWMLLGRSYMILGRHADAAKALEHALGPSQGDGRVWAAYGEALTLAAGGTVTPEAAQAFERALEQMPGEPRSRFYLGLAVQQKGDHKGALARWVALEADTPEGAPWEAMLAQHIETAGTAAGVDVAAARQAALSARPGGRRPPAPVPPARPPVAAAPTQPAPPPAPPPSAAGAAPPRGPSQADVRAAEGMAPADRQAMIQGMVDGLAAKLKDNPGDLQGWLRLGRSYGVLGRADESRAAYARAAALAPDDAEVQMQYARALFPQGTPEDAMPAAFKDTIRRVLRLQPENAEAMFYGGMAAAADGDAAAAKDLWRRLLDRMGPGAPARAMIEQRIKDLGG